MYLQIDVEYLKCKIKQNLKLTRGLWFLPAATRHSVVGCARQTHRGEQVRVGTLVKVATKPGHVNTHIVIDLTKTGKSYRKH